MKKVFYVITIILMLSVFPNYTAEAKTLSKPKIELKYSTDNDSWYVRFSAPTKKKAKVKYRFDFDKKYQSAKGKTKWLTTDEFDDFVVYVTDGKNKSKKAIFAMDKEIDKQKTADILNDTKEYVDKDADEFTKLAQLCDYYMYSGNFKYEYGMHPDYNWYYEKGACDYLANTFIAACRAYGIRAKFACDDTHAWTYVYLTGEKDPIVIDPSSLILYEDLCASNTEAYVRDSQIKLSNRDKTKYGFSVLCIKGATYSKDKVTVNAGENGCLPGYEDYYDIYTYSEEKQYWEKHEYDANGIEAKPSGHFGDEDDVCWCWYYGEEGCDGSIAFTEGYVRDE